MLTRATLPQEFYDITSSMLLVQPQKQYLHGTLLKSALRASLMPGGALGFMAGRQFGGEGAPYSSVDMDRLILSDPILSSAISGVNELGKTPGHTVRINRPVYLNTTYTQASREIASGATISTTPIDVSSEQTAITLKRFGGPYDSTNSRVAPFAADRFDAGLSLHKVVDILGKQLVDDFDHFCDAMTVLLYDAVVSTNALYPVGMSAVNDSLVAGDFPMDYDLISRADQKLDELNVPYFADGKRVMVLSPQQCQQLEGDSQFGRFAQFNAEINPVLNKSYYKSVGKFNIFKSNSITQTANSTPVTIHYGQAFGPGMVGVGSSGPPRVVNSTADNFGEQALVCWLWYAGAVTLDNRFGVSLRTS